MDRFVSVAEPVVGEPERSQLEEVLESGRFLQGPKVEAFEDAWADVVDVEHAIATNNCTTAIQLALKAIGLQPGDEVIVPSLTFGSTATAVVHQAGVPVFADIERDIYTIDPSDLERCLSNRTKAVIPVHLYGHPAEMDAINDFAASHDLIVIEDAAQAHGAKYNGEPVGSLGDLGCFSFYATKNITTGEGGIITTDRADLAQDLRQLRSHGMANRDEHVTLGYNYRMNEFNAAVGIPQIDRLDGFNEKRARITHRLFNELDGLDWLSPAAVRDYVKHAFFWAPFEVITDSIDMTGKAVWRELQDYGVETRHRYVEPLYKQPVFQEHRGFNSEFPWTANEHEHAYDLELENVESVAGNMIGLPNHQGLDDEDVDFVIEAVKQFSADHM